MKQCNYSTLSPAEKLAADRQPQDGHAVRPVPHHTVFDMQVYSEQIGNLMMDALSAKKYYHFVRLMGRAASHITLECALQTHPQAAIICEELHHSKQRLADIVREVCCAASRR